MRFIQFGILFIILIALLVYIPHIINTSFGISQVTLIQIEAILGVFVFQLSMVIREKDLEKKLVLDIESKLLKNEELKKKIKKIEQNNLKQFIRLNNITIDVTTLTFIRSEGHYLNIYTTNNKKFIRGKISKIKGLLPSNFIQPHRSYIVNFNYVKDVFPNFIIMKDKTEIPISRSKKQMVKDKLIEGENN